MRNLILLEIYFMFMGKWSMLKDFYSLLQDGYCDIICIIKLIWPILSFIYFAYYIIIEVLYERITSIGPYCKWFQFVTVNFSHQTIFHECGTGNFVCYIFICVYLLFTALTVRSLSFSFSSSSSTSAPIIKIVSCLGLISWYVAI